MEKISQWPTLLSSEWQYEGIHYPWHRFRSKITNTNAQMGIMYLSCAKYVIIGESGKEVDCTYFSPLLPSGIDYQNYLP